MHGCPASETWSMPEGPAVPALKAVVGDLRARHPNVGIVARSLPSEINVDGCTRVVSKQLPPLDEA